MQISSDSLLLHRHISTYLALQKPHTATFAPSAYKVGSLKQQVVCQSTAIKAILLLALATRKVCSLQT